MSEKIEMKVLGETSQQGQPASVEDVRTSSILNQLSQQRNEAMDKIASMTGEMAVVVGVNSQLVEEVKRLRAIIDGMTGEAKRACKEVSPVSS